jgi:tight adherence protein B
MSILQVLVALAAAAAIAFVTYTIVSPLSAWWDRYLTKWSRWMQLEFEAMHQEMPRNRARKILSYSVLVMSVLGFLVNFSVLFALVFGSLGLLVPRWVIGWLRERRFRQINAQLGEALTLVSSALRSGLSLPQGVELVVQEMEPPIAEEFAIVIKENRLGLSFDEALSNLAEVFDVIAHTVRERKKVEGKIQAMTAEGMTQGVMMCAVPPVLIVAFYFLDPTLVEPLFTSVLGILMLLVIVGMDAMGMWMIRNTVKIDV